MITGMIPNFTVSVVLSKYMPSVSLASMKLFCKENNIQYQFGFKKIEADLISTANYPLLLKKEFIENNLCVNTHYALLPKYRGIHPIQCALLNDEKEIGYTVHRVDEGMDSGPIFFQHRIHIREEDNVHTLTESMTNHFVLSINRYFSEILAGLKPTPQIDSDAVYCGKRKEDDGLIDWKMSSRFIFNLVRAICPPYYAGAFTFMNGTKFVITKANMANIKSYYHTPGQVINISKEKGFLVKTGDTAIWIERIKSLENENDSFILDEMGKKIGIRFSSDPVKI